MGRISGKAKRATPASGAQLSFLRKFFARRKNRKSITFNHPSAGLLDLELPANPFAEEEKQREKKERARERARNRWLKMTPAQKAARQKQNNESRIRRRAKMTPEEKEKEEQKKHMQENVGKI